MALEELDDLVNSFSEANRAKVRELLAADQSAQAALTNRETVFKAFTTGDLESLPKPAVAAPPAAAPSVDLAALETRLNERFSGLFKAPEFQAAVDARAKELADEAVKAARPQLIGQGAELADTIASIRESHLQEFGERLDSAAFKKYFADNATKFAGDLQSGYDAYVGEKRVQKKIADAVAADRATRATNQVPGSALPESDSVGGAMLRHNMERTGGKVDSAQDADAAARAFSAMRSGWTQ
jgi:hypothetical protein